MTRDPNSYIQASANALAETLLSKNEDYAPTGEFSNFEKAAEIAGIDVTQLITAQIAIKMTRIEKLMRQSDALNEPLKDSLLDLAGYAIIAHAYLESQDKFNTIPGANRLGWKSDDYSDRPNLMKDYVVDREQIRNIFDVDGPVRGDD